MVVPERPNSRSNRSKKAIIAVFVLSACLFLLSARSNPEHNVIDDSHVESKQKKITVSAADKDCSLQRLCDNTDAKFSIRMMAMPHTASTTTQRVFKEAEVWDSNVKNRGLSCFGSIVPYYPTTCDTTNDDSLLQCVLKKFTYKGKAHMNYNQMKQTYSHIFTTLRQPLSFVLSQYKMRSTWDKASYKLEYPSGNVTSTTIETWVTQAWWRHNLFTKMLATDSQVLWISSPNPLTPTKEESDKENALGRNSTLFNLALKRLKGLPVFGLMHRLDETFELFGFHYCFPVKEQRRINRRQRIPSPELQSIVNKTFVLDTLLLQEAEVLFNDLVADMRRKKKEGILCNLGRVLHEKEPVGFKCVLEIN